MKVIGYICVFVLGGALSATGYHFGLQAFNAMNGEMSSDMNAGSLNAKDEKTPLYWVAPMDPNYRRDKPGLSPMGMDLIPFYGADQGSDNAGVGTVSISPEVVNNLGVRTEKVFQGMLKPDIRTVGYLAYNEDKIVHIHPRVEGWVEKSFIKSNGDSVEKGQPLFDLYSPTLVNAQEEFVFALARKDKRMINAGEERLKALQVSSDFIKALRTKRKVSQTVRFFAPQSGVIDNLGIQDGFYIKPGTTLMSIADLSEVWLDAEVFERQAHRVAVGQPVEAVTDFLPGKTFASNVDFIYPTLNVKNRTLRVRIRLDNPEQLLKPDMFAHVRIETTEPGQKRLISKEALIRGGEQNRVVLALGEGRYKSIAVKTGAFGDDYVEILDGLVLGDDVVTSAQFLLDSESSKSSDFKRMNADSNQTAMSASDMSDNKMSDQAEPVAKPANNVWVAARINRIDATTRMVNVNHEAISDWNWPKMTMDFVLADWLELDELPIGKNIQLEITRESSTKFAVTDFFDADAE
ncbi:efflux RND transporter periplasmic adaptor subunit [Marinomonas transparens]|uniref:Efflux RND transporter periplasmic adaptor subunit n=1 Tax=Marinomonas transparens TaxID=2795388 RepID=A0A934JQ66_9GAMM|nr:efflux RND transporter periplasmic adaptor subunit [Marinomonas transparens]MBJ7539911.1 efflux RND transporter periplasmic adaptor subunit [Marinomonas transparens]